MPRSDLCRPFRDLGVAATLAFTLALAAPRAGAQERVLDAGTHRLRMGARPEWAERARLPHARELILRFTDRPNPGEQTLVLRQEGVKQSWRVILNGHELATLRLDENPMITHTAIPAGVLVAGENRLRIEPA